MTRKKPKVTRLGKIVKLPDCEYRIQPISKNLALLARFQWCGAVNDKEYTLYHCLGLLNAELCPEGWCKIGVTD